LSARQRRVYNVGAVILNLFPPSHGEGKNIDFPPRGGIKGGDSVEYQTPSEDMIYNSTDIKSLLHLNHPLHSAIFVDEEHERIFTSGDNFSVEIGDFYELFNACTKLINSGEVQGKV
jgi:hypothetical protein